MASTYTTNKSIEEPARGDYSGTWDTPVNSNWSVIDLALGSVQVIDLSGGSVVLSTAQARSPFLTFKGALPGNVTVTIPGLSSSPGSIVSGGFYTVNNECTGSFTVTMQTTVSGQEKICCPPNNATDIYVLGTNSSQAGAVKYRSLPPVGTYQGYYGSAVPNWVSGCTKPPYLECNAASFSSATYPALRDILGGTTVPDLRGRAFYMLNQGTGRLTGGIDGNTLGAAGGSPTTTIAQANIPSYNLTVTDPTHNHTVNSGSVRYVGQTGGVYSFAPSGTTLNFVLSPEALTIDSHATGITVGSAGSGTAMNTVGPGYVGGIVMIRAG